MMSESVQNQDYITGDGPHSPVLTTEQLQRELNYRVAMNLACTLQAEGVVTEREARKIKRKIAAGFSPVWSGIA
jgi:hypothetical protein